MSIPPPNTDSQSAVAPPPTARLGHEFGRDLDKREKRCPVVLPESRTRRGLKHLLREGLVPIALGGLLAGLQRGGFLELTMFFAVAEVLRHLHVEHGSSPSTRNARRIIAPLLVPGPAAFLTGAFLPIEDLSMYGWFLARYVDYLLFAIALGVAVPVIHALRGDPEHYPD